MQSLTRCDDGARSGQHTDGRSAGVVPDVDDVGLVVAGRRAGWVEKPSRFREPDAKREQAAWRQPPDCSQTRHQATHVPRSPGQP